MGIFSKIKSGISSKANAALDKAIDPEKELDMAILELEEGRKKALAELVSYKATAKQMDMEMEKQKTKAAEWEKRAMLAIRAGDDTSAKEALKKKKECETEYTKIERDKHEAASYAIQLNKSRKEFETKLQMLKLRKGTLATQIAAARSAGGDAFGNDTSVWDKFKAAEDRIDQEAIASEVDASMRGEDAEALMLESKINAATANAGLLPEGGDSLEALKAKMAADKAAKQKALAAAQPAQPKLSAPAKPDAKTDAKPEAKTDAPKTDAPKTDAPKTDAPKTDVKADAPKADAGTEGGAKTEEAPRPEVKIDLSKLEAELAAMRAALKDEK